MSKFLKVVSGNAINFKTIKSIGTVKRSDFKIGWFLKLKCINGFIAEVIITLNNGRIMYKDIELKDYDLTNKTTLEDIISRCTVTA